MIKLYKIEIYFDDATCSIYSEFTKEECLKILDVFQKVSFFWKNKHKRYRIKGEGIEAIINLDKVKNISVIEIEEKNNG